MKRKAFTLIELLIVVAIIAILAAIAVPNFLEAQVRSKVSRSKNDLRTIATAIEAYAVDNRHYPIYGTFTINTTASGDAQILEPALVTTPIAYLSGDAPLKDPFRTQDPPANWPSPGNLDPDLANPLKKAYYFRMYNYVNWDDARYKNYTIVDVHGRYGEWRLTGAGPDKWFFNTTYAGDQLAAFITVAYDSTNGTTSIGDIRRWHKKTEPAETY